MAILAGKTLFISGASRGIGLAIALRAAQDGAEQFADNRGRAAFDFVDVLGALVVPSARMALGVAVVEIGVEQRPCRRRENILAGNQVDRLGPPLVLGLAKPVHLAQ